MTQRFVIKQPLEPAYVRNALFAVELLDAVTLSRVTEGITIVAEGLRGTPFVNTSGLFVWRQEDITPLQKISIDPGTLPYEARELPRAALTLPPLPRPLTTIELSPRVSYAFAAGTTGARGTLVEERVVPPQRPVPVRDAEVALRWLDEDGVTWHDAPIASHTTDGGDFVSVLRLTAAEVPHLDVSGAVTVRLRVRRDANERQSADLKLPQGRVADPSTLNTLIFAWDELQP